MSQHDKRTSDGRCGAQKVWYSNLACIYQLDDWATAWTMDRDMFNCAFRYFYFFCAFSSSNTGSQWQLTWETFLAVSTYRKLVMRCRKIWKTKLIIKSTRFFFHVVRVVFFSSFLSPLVPLLFPLVRMAIFNVSQDAKKYRVTRMSFCTLALVRSFSWHRSCRTSYVASLTNLNNKWNELKSLAL